MATATQTAVFPRSLSTKGRNHFLHLDIPLPVSFGALSPGFYDQPRSSFLDEQPTLTCWLVDTRCLWPGASINTAAGVQQALNLISPAEQKIVKGKLHIADAKMSLASALLKRMFISQTLEIPWDHVHIARKGNEKHGKPCAVDEVGRPIDGIDFNVSHQNGLVALIGWNGRRRRRYSPGGHIQGMLSPRINANDVMVGVDIVCVNERESAATTIEEEGLDGWVDVYDAVFSDEERWSMKYDVDYVTLLDGSTLSGQEIGRHDRCISRHKNLRCTTSSGQCVDFSSERLIEAKMRRFYTYFCYKEAYIKLAGEALLAPWLKQLEFSGVRSPKPGAPARCSLHGVWGEEVDDVEVRLHGRVVEDVKMKVQAFEETFMLSTAIQGNIQGLTIPAFQSLSLLEIYAQAASAKSSASDARSVGSPVELTSPWESRYWS
ncbi:hypothetical protein K470DRAFT_257965 [Piedraia hortae CBS 480.64]|uniref:holo-[acyl-carrier-protein] synthase n=1 Tax=Piedraia hortae CBS 480.64 TaxID=1314780 RepID=A0A6A7BZE3_9PEZI|nr:hypothetical protein K470DRAFT_257965 [Piedraia hortae CBS 480.64]